MPCPGSFVAQNIQAGGDVLIRFGLATAVTTFRIRVTRLLEDYLGKAGAPMPFGGRQREITLLNAWLTDREAPGSMLVTAPAGRGKTALLTRWIAQLDGNIDICFVPISIRYDTNRSGVFYQAMAHRLAEILGADLPQAATNLTDFYKDKVLEFIEQFSDRPRRCLLVIDGLDEAAGWQVDSSVLPPMPSSGLRIVVSARQLAGHRGSSDWKTQLGWDYGHAPARDFEVPLLDREGIADVLRSMGDPLAGMSATVDLVAQLHRLTEGGDPLLLKLYVEDLTKPAGDHSRLHPETLPALPSGFGAYFKRWFKEQRDWWRETGQTVDEPRLDAILAVLACALGALSLKDIGHLVDEVAPGGPIVTLNTIAPLRRFIIGDGLDSNLALSHPKLATFIKELYFGCSQIIDDVGAAYLRWGTLTARELDSGVRSPSAASRYILTYYLQHLQAVRPAPLDRFRDLANAGWRAAWQHYEGGDRSFSEQLETCFVTLLDACQQDSTLLRRPGTGVGGLVHIGLCLSSIRSSGTNCPVNFLAEMTREGLISPRHALFVSSFQSDEIRAALIIRLAPTLDQSLFAEFEREAGQLRLHEYRVKSLVALAQRMPPTDQRRLLTDVVVLLGPMISNVPPWSPPWVKEAIRAAVAVAIDGNQPFAPELHDLAAKYIAADQLPSLQPVGAVQGPQQIIDGTPWGKWPIYVSSDNPLVVAARSYPTLAAFAKPKPMDQKDYVDAIQHVLALHPELNEVLAQRILQSPDPAFSNDSRDMLSHAESVILNIIMKNSNDEYFVNMIRSAFESLNVNLGKYFTGPVEINDVINNLAESLLEPPEKNRILYMIGSRLSLVAKPLLHWLLRAMIARNEYEAARFLDLNAPFFDSEFRRQLIAIVSDIETIYADDIAACLTLSNDGELLDEILERLGSITNFFETSAWKDAALLKKLLPACSESQIGALIRRLLRLPDMSYSKRRMLNECARVAPLDVQSLLLDRALTAPEDGGYALLATLAPSISSEVMQQVLNRAGNLPDVSERVKAVDALLPFLSEQDRARAMRQVYRLALEIHDEPFQLVTLAALGQTQASTGEAGAMPAWASMLAQTSAGMHRALSSCLIALLPTMSAEKAKAALLEGLAQADRLSRDNRSMIWSLGALAPHLNKIEARMVIGSALKCFDDASDEQSIEDVLLLLSPHLEPREYDRIVAKSQERATSLADHVRGRWLCMAFLAASPSVPVASARRTIDAWLARLAEPDDIDEPEHKTTLPFLMLSSHLTAAEQETILSELENYTPDADDDRIPQYTLLPYMKGAALERLGLRLLEQLRRSPRNVALSLLALVEGNWGETIKLKPAFAEGRPASSLLARLGGPGATREAIDAITFAARTWP